MKENRLKKARERVGYSYRRAVAALNAAGMTIGLTKLQKVEGDGTGYFPAFDPADLSTRELEAFAALYGVAPAVLLGRAPFPERAELAEAV